MPRGDQRTAKLHRDWLRQVSEQTRMPLTRLAKELKISPSTLTRPVSEGDTGTSTLHAATIHKIVQYTGLAAPEANLPSGRRVMRGFAEEAMPFVTEDVGLKAAVRALIGGRNGVDPWQLKTRALEGVGFLSGDVVIVDLNLQPQQGDAVCAQVYDWQGGKAETIWRVFDPPVLIGATQDFGRHPKPQIVDNDRVIIKGVIIGMIRPSVLRAA